MPRARCGHAQAFVHLVLHMGPTQEQVSPVFRPASSRRKIAAETYGGGAAFKEGNKDMARRQISCWDLPRRLLVASGPLWSPHATITDCPWPPGHGFLALQERRLKHGTRRAGSSPFTRRPSRCRVPLRRHSRHLSFHTWAHIF